MPDEVFDIWIEPLIKDYGWPFSKDSTTAQDTKWRYIFPVSFLFCRNLKWTYQQSLNTNFLDSQTLEEIKEIIDFCVFGKIKFPAATSMARIENTVARFNACTGFIRDNNRLPLPIVVFETNNGIALLDGAHRLSAWFHLRASHVPIPAWIGIKEKQ